MVPKLIYALLRANEPSQKAFFLRQLPLTVYPTHRAEMLWLTRQRERLGSYPSLSAFTARFPRSPLPKSRDSLGQVTQELIDLDIFSRMSEAVNASKKLLDGGSDMGETLSFLRTSLADVTDHSVVSEDLKVGAASVVDDRYRERVNLRRTATARFEPTPWKSVNELLGYSEHGEQNLIAARTSIGKTWIAIHMAVHLARLGERVLFTSKEMTSPQLMDRFEADLFRFSHPDFRRGKLRPRELRRWRTERQAYATSVLSGNLILTGEETIAGTGFRHLLQKVEEHRPTVLFIDGAYLLHPEGKKYSNDVMRFTDISNFTKRLAKTYRMMVFPVVQGNRTGETLSGDTKPSLSSIYGADAWAQDSDNVFILSGRRGAPSRLLTLAKGRESNIGDVAIGFQLHPFPHFPEMAGASALASSTVSFNAA